MLFFFFFAIDTGELDSEYNHSLGWLTAEKTLEVGEWTPLTLSVLAMKSQNKVFLKRPDRDRQNKKEELLP